MARLDGVGAITHGDEMILNLLPAGALHAQTANVLFEITIPYVNGVSLRAIFKLGKCIIAGMLPEYVTPR